MRLKKMLSLLLLGAALLAASEAQSLPGCPDKCGNVSIPYPFGVGVQHGTGRNCFLATSFNLTCTDSILYTGNVAVSDISLRGHLDMSMAVSTNCYNEPGVVDTGGASLGTAAFTISSTANKFYSVGCDTYGYFNSFQNNLNYSTGCFSRCNTRPNEANARNCSGIGCCQVDIPIGMRNVSFEAFSFNNHSKVLGFNNCSYAFVAKQAWFNFSLHYLNNLNFSMAPLVADWSVSSVTCEVARGTQDYACTSNSYCENYEDGIGYNCRCRPGFDGNPYHPDGCHDIDECRAPNNCSEHAQCHNFDGSYNCSCPPGYKGNGYVNGTPCSLDTQSDNDSLILKVALGVSVALVVVFALVSSLCWVHKQRTLTLLRRRYFDQNGGTTPTTARTH